MDLTADPSRQWHQSTQAAMGCIAEVIVDGPSEHVREAFFRLEHLEQTWSRFRSNSELNRFQDNHGYWQTISADLVIALQWAVRLHSETGGLFDPTVRRSLEALGYRRPFGNNDQVNDAVLEPAPGLAAMQLDGHLVQLERPVGIDLGGLTKGLAADLIANSLVADGSVAALVSVGGNMHVAGVAPDGGWPVPLLHPDTGESFATHHLHHGAMATSTTRIRRWHVGTDEVHHIIDPRTGHSADDAIVAVSTIGQSAVRAEGFAKAAIIAGPTAAEPMLRQAGLGGWLVHGDGTVTTVSVGPPGGDAP